MAEKGAGAELCRMTLPQQLTLMLGQGVLKRQKMPPPKKKAGMKAGQGCIRGRGHPVGAGFGPMGTQHIY